MNDNKILDEILNSSDLNFIIERLDKINLDNLDDDSLAKLSEHLQKFIKILPKLKKFISIISGVHQERLKRKFQKAEENKKEVGRKFKV